MSPELAGMIIIGLGTIAGTLGLLRANRGKIRAEETQIIVDASVQLVKQLKETRTELEAELAEQRDQRVNEREAFKVEIAELRAEFDRKLGEAELARGHLAAEVAGLRSFIRLNTPFDPEEIAL